MSEIPKVPKRLLESKEEILGGFGSKLATNYDASAWQKHFKGDSDFEQISQEFPSSIRRIDMERLSRKVRNGDYKQVRKLFLASMVWGYVRDDRRGAWRTKQMLSYTRAGEILEKAARWISDGQIVEACKGFKLPWCGSAFSTKFFYFIGLGAGISPLPYILDSNVAQSLEQLGKEEGWNLPPFDNVYGKGIRRCPEGYIQYIWALDEWAKELGCRADYIEYFLYNLGRSLSKRQELQKGESMKNYITLEDCKAFANGRGYTNDIKRIESKNRPPNWKYRDFRHARIGEFLKVFNSKGSWPTFYQLYCQKVPTTRITRYMTQAQNLFNSGLPVVTIPPADTPGVVAPTEEEACIQVHLPKGGLEKLEEKAKRFGVDPCTLARIWILERLS
jgi:hypothetical protein